MKLSEAIREGALLRPQAYGVAAEDYGGCICTCALGAAYEVMFGYLFGLDELPAGHPHYIYYWYEDAGVPRALVSEVIDRNDTWHQSREEIADWVQEQGF